MDDLLGACVELETLAVEVYSLFAATTQDKPLKHLFEQLRADETDHLAWWGEIRKRVESGEIEPIDTGTHVVAYMRAIVATLRAMLVAAPGALADDDRLALAASLEFFQLDPVFAQLIRASDPKTGASRDQAYRKHVQLLVSTIEARRSWQLAPHVALLRAADDRSEAAVTDDLHDPVTALPLRPMAEEALDALCDDPGRDDEAISLAVIDIGLGSLYEEDPARADRTLLRITSATTSLLRFTDLLVRLDGDRLAVVMPATSSAAACASVSALADAVAGIALAAGCGDAPASATSAVVTLLPGHGRCSAGEAFAAVIALLGDAQSAGEPLAALELG
jgi:GGDEF domain-containing protein